MNKEKIIQLIRSHLERYERQVNFSKEKMKRHIYFSTSQQIAQENIFILDMESRAYALVLLLEELEETDDE